MKKYLILFIAVIIFIGGIFLAKYYIIKNTVEVEIYKVRQGTIKTYVECAGKIEALTKENIYSENSLYIEKINVTLGQNVNSGDLLADVDTEKSAKSSTAAQNSTDLSNLPGLPAFNADITANSSAASSTVEIKDKIKSPLTGVVIEINATENTYTNISKPLFTICDLNSLTVKTSVPENQISMLEIGQSAIIKGTGFKGRYYNGQIKSINPVAKETLVGTTSQTAVETVIEIFNPDAYLKPGFSAEVKILAGKKENIISIPYETILQDSDNNEFVYLYTNGKIIKRIIETGLESENSVEVEGLSIDDLIVFNPDEFLSDGQRVRARTK